MRFLRVFLNSLLSGLFFSLLLSLLIANININAKPDGRFYFWLTLFLTPLYGLATCLAFMIFYFLTEFLFGRPFRIKALSPSFLSLSFSLSLIIFLIFFRLNYGFYRSFFSPFLMSQFQIQFLAGSIIIISGLVAFWRYHRHRPYPLYLITYFLILFLGLGVMFWARWRFPQPSPPSRITVLESFPASRKATILNFEGLSFDFLIPLIQNNHLPNFSWLMENGSWGRLQTLSPTDSFILKKSFLTGKNPYGHRCLSPLAYSFFGKKPFLEALPRFILLKQLTRIKVLKTEPISNHSHKSIWQILSEMNLKISSHEGEGNQNELQVLSPRAEKIWASFFAKNSSSDPRLQLVRQALSQDIGLEEKAHQQKIQNQPQVWALFLKGLNQVKIFFYKYSFPHLFGNIDQEEISRYGHIIDKYYQFYDQLLGKYLANLKDDEVLFVFSTHGMEPLPLWKRLVEWALGNPQVSGHFEFAPDGVIFFYGRDIVRGQSLDKIKLVDIIPTLLYLLGLPVARDMDGVVCSSIFRPEFSVENPIFYISSYQEVAIKPGRR